MEAELPALVEIQIDLCRTNLRKIMADALQAEFGNFMSGSDTSWAMAADGIVAKMGMDVVGWISEHGSTYPLAQLPGHTRFRPCYAIARDRG